ncbi:MAG TPA: hypothetical protein VK590_10355 [Saprospiraceae bacterium]|nr:hypothetical protein [Saprospiraceae bacterium]
MKKTFLTQLLFFLIILFNQISNAFPQSGIYKSWQDYKNAKISNSINCKSSSDNIKLNHIISTSYIEISQSGKSIRFKKDSIFGYKDCNQKDFRFYKRKEYEILESKSLIIYSTYTRDYSSTGKTFLLKSEYFFSVDLNAPVLSLSLLNLKKATLENLKFHDSLDIEFGNGSPLNSIDNKQNMFKINSLLTKSLNLN